MTATPTDITEWMIDVVAATVITRSEFIGVIRKVDAMRKGLRGPIVLEPEATERLYRADRRDGTVIRARHITLAPGCSYVSADDNFVSTAGWGSDDVGMQRVHFPSTLRIDGSVPPNSMLETLPGRHVSAVVSHPMLADPRLVIKTAGLNGSPGDWRGMYVTLPQIDVPLHTATILHQRNNE